MRACIVWFVNILRCCEFEFLCWYFVRFVLILVCTDLLGFFLMPVPFIVWMSLSSLLCDLLARFNIILSVLIHSSFVFICFIVFSCVLML